MLNHSSHSLSRVGRVYILQTVVCTGVDEYDVGFILWDGYVGFGVDLVDDIPRPAFHVVVSHVAVCAGADHVHRVAAGREKSPEGGAVAVAVGRCLAPGYGGAEGHYPQGNPVGDGVCC